MHITIQLSGTCIKYSKVILGFHEMFIFRRRGQRKCIVLDNKEVKNTGLKKLNILFQVEAKHS